MTVIEGKDLFLVELAARLIASAMSVPPFLQKPLVYLISWVLGAGMSYGILQIDLTVSAWKIAREKKEFKDLAEKAFKRATARVYTEEEKNAIRKEYQDLLRKFGTVGDKLRER